MAVLNNLVAFLSLVALLPIVSSNNADLGSLLNQASGGNGGLNNGNLGGLLNQATGGNGGLDNLGGLLNQATGGNGGLNNVDLGDLLNQATGGNLGLVKDEDGKVNMAETLKELQKLGLTLKDLLKAAGLGDNPQVLAIAEQFITDPNSLDEGQKVIVCEAMEVLMEDKPEVGNTLATLGMDTTTLCATRYFSSVYYISGFFRRMWFTCFIVNHSKWYIEHLTVIIIQDKPFTFPSQLSRRSVKQVEFSWNPLWIVSHPPPRCLCTNLIPCLRYQI